MIRRELPRCFSLHIQTVSLRAMLQTPKILVIAFCFAVLITASVFLSACSLNVFSQLEPVPDRPSDMKDSELYGSVASPSSSSMNVFSPTPTPTPTLTPTPTPTAKMLVVSFLGDCTLGQNRGVESASYSFSKVVGTDYAYPFKNAVDILSMDDLTLVNLEGPLTNSNTYRDKEFTFKGPPEYVDILSLGSVEAVNLSNNHSYDYWDSGLTETQETLEAAGILWSDNDDYAIYEVDGIKIGMAGFSFPYQMKPIYTAIDSLRDQGCAVVIISVHCGVERMYEPESVAVNMAHDIIDYGADIYVGHHPHRLQPIEYYNGKYILYSLSNFVFGGQPWLTDPDTAIVQGVFTVEYGEMIDCRLNVIPYSMTTTFPGNDYCPLPYEIGSDKYYDVMDKLRWSDSPE